MTTTVGVRRAKLADRSVVLAFHLALYIDHRTAVMVPQVDELSAHRSFTSVLRDDVDAMLRDANTIVLIAERAGEPVGYATGQVTHDPRRVLPGKGVVGDWYVDESARGLGVGAQLLDELERHFVAANCQVMESATWSYNRGARAAHEALGFSEAQVTYRKRIGG